MEVFQVNIFKTPLNVDSVQSKNPQILNVLNPLEELFFIF